MRYKIDDILEFKKNHACGSNKWRVIRVGADIKLECVGCLRQISLLASQIDKRLKHKKL